ncbi:MAG: type II toxin-antitoxin system RelE/ParE family toxin [Nanoarchaeota archaeon]|nr:type II toxin-antitoxin system RelE/ParE family toxin [Nanoarchaeota archaeon]
MHESVFSDEFKKQLKKLKKKDKTAYIRLTKKIKRILIEPAHFKHLKNILKREQRTQLGPFVFRFEVKENRVYFITFKHHDSAY